MEIVIDAKTVTEAGFDEYLGRSILPDSAPTTQENLFSRVIDASNIVGGIIGNEGILYLGSKQVRLDGKNKRIVINDGTTDRVIIGYLG